jgi:hypothetical protein
MFTDISIYRIILAVIAALFLANGVWKFLRKEKGQTIFKFLVTLIVWINIFSFAIFPGISHTLSAKLGLGENLNTLIFTGFVVIFVIIFKIISILERIERDISEIVRKEALSRPIDKER